MEIRCDVACCELPFTCGKYFVSRYVCVDANKINIQWRIRLLRTTPQHVASSKKKQSTPGQDYTTLNEVAWHHLCGSIPDVGSSGAKGSGGPDTVRVSKTYFADRYLTPRDPYLVAIFSGCAPFPYTRVQFITAAPRSHATLTAKRIVVRDSRHFVRKGKSPGTEIGPVDAGNATR